MSQPKKRLGRPRKGKEPRMRIPFSVSVEDEAWLQALPNRSEWLRTCIESERKRSNALLSQTPPDTEPH